MKFLADMGISPKTVAFLRTLGHDAVHLADQGLQRLPDPDIVEKAGFEPIGPFADVVALRRSLFRQNQLVLNSLRLVAGGETTYESYNV